MTTEGRTTEFRLITTIVDHLQAPAVDLAQVYGKWWEIESCLDELKTHQRGPGVVLRSKTLDGVIQELYGYLLTHYALRFLIGTVAEHFEEYPLRISFTRTLRAVKRSLVGHPGFSP